MSKEQINEIISSGNPTMEELFPGISEYENYLHWKSANERNKKIDEILNGNS